MKTRVLIERGDDGSFSVYTTDLKTTIMGDGDSVEDAKRDFLQGVEELKLSYTERGEDLPDYLVGLSFEYVYDIASFFDCYPLNMTKIAKMAGINASLMRQYKNGQYISSGRMMEIQDVIRKIGKDMAECELC